eukprot:1091390-Alexandrium_andersonii.AAC.1
MRGRRVERAEAQHHRGGGGSGGANATRRRRAESSDRSLAQMLMNVLKEWQEGQSEEHEDRESARQSRESSREPGGAPTRGRSSSPQPWGFKHEGRGTSWADASDREREETSASAEKQKKTKKKKNGKGSGNVTEDLSRLLKAEKTEEDMIDGLKTILRRAENRSMRPSGKGTETRAQSEHPWQRDRRERESSETERPSSASRV